MNNSSKGLQVFVLLAVLTVSVVLIFMLVRRGDEPVRENEEEQENLEDESAVDEEVEDSEDEEEPEEIDEVEENQDSAVLTSDFTRSDQSVGTSSEDASYTLVSITDTPMGDFHRFVFELESDEEEIGLAEARLVASGGYVRLRLDRVTSDQSGIGYQQSREINEKGISRLYHDVTPVASEEVYTVGVADSPRFYLHEGLGLKIILDVEYPGEEELVVNADDSEKFTDEDLTLSGTNTEEDARIISYSWSVGDGLLKFVWGTSAASGNPTPPTTVTYGDNEITVKFSEVQSDAAIGSDGEFEAVLTGIVERVTGTRTGAESTYVFHLSENSLYRVSRSVSPNQVVLEIHL